MSEHFINAATVSRALSEFTWAEKYSVENGTSGIEVIFPKTIIYFEEDLVPFLRILCGMAPRTGGIYASLPDILSCLIPGYRWKLREGVMPKSDDLVNALPSETVARQMLRNHLLHIQQYLLPVIGGDHSWIDIHDQFLSHNAEICRILGPQAHQHIIYEKFIKGDKTWRTDLEKKAREESA